MTVRVFVFDDDDGIRTMLTRIFERRGYEVFAYSGPFLCQKCQCQDGQVCADIMISDVDMPELTGLEFIKKQKTKGCKVANVALMSGKWAEYNLRQAQKYDCHVFHKPMDLKELSKWLDSCEKKINPNRTLAAWFHKLLLDERVLREPSG